MPSPTIYIDIELKEIFPTFIEHCKKDLRSIENALAERDFKSIQIIGHKMLGSGGGYGLDKLSEIGKSLEQAAKVNDLGSIVRSKTELAEFLQNLRVEFRALD